MPNHQQPDVAVYRTLLESTKAIPWKIDWATMAFSYIGPQIEALLGYPPESWKSAQDWAERIHPEERQGIVDYCIAQSKAGIDHEADYRALTANGSFVWIRDVVHVVRDEKGVTQALVGFMFDISERKKTEERVMKLQRELEELSFKDGLTGIGNRRRFDALLKVEWSSARRNRHPLSLVMIDIDFFKQYNDRYGHVGGDDCLKVVAHTLEKVANRPRDFIARYGGEEFVLLLPETDEQGAKHIASICRDAVRLRKIPHETSNIAPIVTVSLGAGTIVPSATDDPMKFLEEVDKSLYRAKQAGRNTLVMNK